MTLGLVRVTFVDAFAMSRKRVTKLEYGFLYQLPRAFLAYLGPGAHNLDASLVIHINLGVRNRVKGARGYKRECGKTMRDQRRTFENELPSSPVRVQGGNVLQPPKRRETCEAVKQILTCTAMGGMVSLFYNNAVTTSSWKEVTEW